MTHSGDEALPQGLRFLCILSTRNRRLAVPTITVAPHAVERRFVFGVGSGNRCSNRLFRSVGCK